jgi:hypothetical protein
MISVPVRRIEDEINRRIFQVSSSEVGWRYCEDVAVQRVTFSRTVEAPG